MARFSEDSQEQVTSKVQAAKIENKKKSDKSTNKKPVDKQKIIVFGVFGAIILVVFGFVAFSLKDDTEKEVTEFETPMSEADKYNSKLEALGEEDKQTYNQNVDLEKTFSEDNAKNKNKEEEEKLKQQIEALNTPKQENVTTPNNNNNSNRYVNNTPIQKQRTVEKPSAEKVEKKEPVKSESGFFNKSSTSSTSSSNETVTLFACIHTDQTVMDGNRVKMRLTKSVTINGDYFPVNTILYGTAKISPNRLTVLINKINQTDVKLEIYDAEDSNSGIYVETPNLNATLKKELQKDAIEDDDIDKVPFSRTLKNLLTKKAKEERIELLNNYKVIIKHEKKKN